MDVGWVAHAVELFFSAVYDLDVAVRKDRRLQFAAGTYESNDVHSVACVEIPNTGTHDIAGPSKHRASNIFGRVSTAGIDCKSLHSGNRPDEKIEQVEAM